MSTRVFQPARLRLARKLRPMSQKALADWLEVTPATISQYEAGGSEPGSAAIEGLAVALKCRPDFFFRPASRQTVGAFFRSLRSTPQSERDRAESYALVLAEIADLLDDDVQLPAVDVPTELRLTPDDSDRAVERMAAKVRDAWQIPSGPIAHVVRLLETHGVVVVAVGDFDQRLDAFSLWASSRPVVVLCTAKGVAKRRRFDAAHELAHLVLHDQPAEANAQQERQAHRFAAAFLMPADEIEPWLPRRSNELDVLEEGSNTWGVSMQALLFRARTLNTLSESSYRRTMTRMSAMGWRRSEPVEAGPEEAPAVLNAAIHALPGGSGSLRVIARRLGLPYGRVARMLAVPEDRDRAPNAEVLELRQWGAAG